MQPTIGDNIAQIRRQHQITQEALAEAAGVSVEVIRKLERGERTSARMETLGKLARALRVPTSRLVGDATTAVARREPAASPVALVDIRRALTPVRGVDGQVLDNLADITPPTLESTRRSLREADQLYHDNDFGSVLRVLPDLLAETRLLVESTSSDDQAVSYVLSSTAHHLAGRLLIQVRAHDLAYTALTAARDDADRSGDDVAIASAVWPMCWLLLRQARLTEATALAITTADRIEPVRLSRAKIEQVEAWSWLLLEAAASASRDGRDDDSQSVLDLATVAAARIDTAADGGIGAAKVAMMRVEAGAVAGDPSRVLLLSEQIPAGRKPLASCWQRHRLDVAWAYAELGQWADATGVLTDLRDRAPTWLRHQRYARDVVATIATGRRRAMSDELATLATLVGYVG